MNAFNLKKTFLLLVGGMLFSLLATHAFSEDKVNQPSKPLHKHYQVEITGFEFVPKNLVVKAGDIVTWVNKDVVPHNVFNSANKQAISPDLATGKSFSYTVPVGSLSYFCSFHPSMVGTLSQ